MRRENVIITLREKIKKFTMELEWVKGSERTSALRRREFDINPVDTAY